MSKKITVVGIGRLGLCVALCLERVGYHVKGCDVFQSYVDSLNNKTFKSTEPRVEELLASSKNFSATTNFSEAINFSDMILIYVATPNSGHDRFYDHSVLGRVLSNINQQKVENKHIVIGCTVIPGYIAQTGRYLLKDCKNTTLSYNPEFIAQGDIINGMLHPDMILIGEGSEQAGDLIEEHYKKLSPHVKVHRMSPESAEICKLSVNCFVTTKVTFANMIGDIADATTGADKYHILDAVGDDSRVGKKYLKPGYGFGGPCFPRDNRALGGYAEFIGVDPILPTATDKANKYHTKRQIDQILQNYAPDDLIIFKGIGYKDPCPVPIIEESQKLVIAEKLAQAGRRVLLVDTEPLIDIAKLEYGNLFEYEIAVTI